MTITLRISSGLVLGLAFTACLSSRGNDASNDGGQNGSDTGWWDDDGADASDAAVDDDGFGSRDAGLPSPPNEGCTAALPTGFCFRSDPGDFVGAGRRVKIAGGNVSFSGGDTSIMVSASAAGQGDWRLELAPPQGDSLHVGTFSPAERAPFRSAGAAGINLSGEGRGCNTITGAFTVTEYEMAPGAGIVRFAATFEQYCEGGGAKLAGAINYNAAGVPDPLPMQAAQVPLSGKVIRVVYDPSSHLVYALDAANRKIATIDLATKTGTYKSVVQVPNDACVDIERGRLFVVNKGSSIISEHQLSDMSLKRQITWGGTDSTSDGTHFHIYCTKDTLYVVDGAWSPGLFTVDNLDEAVPTVTDHSMEVAGVGGMVVNEQASDLYYWEQVGWGAGLGGSAIYRLGTDTLMARDQSVLTYQQGFSRDPLDAPILLDETRGLIFAKDRVFDAANLTKVVFTLPGSQDPFDGATENAYAVDPARGLLATRNFVYELDTYGVLVPTLTKTAAQMFFDRDGLLWYLNTGEGVLKAQAVPAP